MFEFEKICACLASILHILYDNIIYLLLLIIIIAVAMSRPVFKYYVKSSNIDPNFKQQVVDIISTCAWNKSYKLQLANNELLANCSIELVPRATLDHLHGTDIYADGRPIRFSVTVTKPGQNPIIYIDDGNWLNSVPESKLTIKEYRQYVIVHELGHALGYAHQLCNNDTATYGICPVMYQSTRGCPDGFQCGTDVSYSDWLNRLYPTDWIKWTSDKLSSWTIE